MKRTLKNPSVQIFIYFGLFIGLYFGGIVALATATGSMRSSKAQKVETQQTVTKTPESVTATATENQATESAQDAPEAVETYQQPPEVKAAPQSIQNEAPAAHIPFTNEPVTAGDPQSYVNTVGQCPFYEMAGEKGCVPPPDIECNADWSDCKLREGTQ